MPPTTHPSAHPARVLVIDDDPVVRELLSALLPSEGHVVLVAESGENALQVLTRGKAVDVILTDVQLPGLTGPALTGQLRKALPSALLLGMSGSEPASEVRDAFDGFLLKPFMPEDFNRAISTAGMRKLATSEPPAETARSSALNVLDEATYERLAARMPPGQLAELYELTLADADMRIQRLTDAHSTQDWETWRREAHALKGGCSMVGASELAALAARAELGVSVDTPHPWDFSAAAKSLRSNLTARFSGIT